MGAKKGQQRIICENRRARFEFDLTNPLIAGLMLLGSEVKALRLGNAHLNDAWVGFEGNKPMLFQAHVAAYEKATHFCHEPGRPRPLLLNASEIEDLRAAVRERGLTVVPLKLYFEGPWVKLELAVGRGRNVHDKRHAVREREDRREMARELARR